MHGEQGVGVPGAGVSPEGCTAQTRGVDAAEGGTAGGALKEAHAAVTSALAGSSSRTGMSEAGGVNHDGDYVTRNDGAGVKRRASDGSGGEATGELRRKARRR